MAFRMRKINYKSDFDFILRLRTSTGDEIGWPDYDWTARIWTTLKVNAFVASCIGGVCRNCYNDGGKIHIVANSHGLSAGRLNIEFTAELPNEIYPDASLRNVVPEPLDIELIRAAAPCPESMEIEMMLPYIRGERGIGANVTGHIEIETNAGVYRIPVVMERVEFVAPDDGYGYYYGSYDTEDFNIGEWDL